MHRSRVILLQVKQQKKTGIVKGFVQYDRNRSLIRFGIAKEKQVRIESDACLSVLGELIRPWNTVDSGGIRTNSRITHVEASTAEPQEQIKGHSDQWLSAQIAEEYRIHHSERFSVWLPVWDLHIRHHLLVILHVHI